VCSLLEVSALRGAGCKAAPAAFELAGAAAADSTTWNGRLSAVEAPSVAAEICRKRLRVSLLFIRAVLRTAWAATAGHGTD